MLWVVKVTVWQWQVAAVGCVDGLGRAHGSILVAVTVQFTHCSQTMHAVGLQAGLSGLYLQPGNQAGRFLVCSYQEFIPVTC